MKDNYLILVAVITSIILLFHRALYKVNTTEHSLLPNYIKTIDKDIKFNSKSSNISFFELNNDSVIFKLLKILVEILAAQNSGDDKILIYLIQNERSDEFTKDFFFQLLKTLNVQGKILSKDIYIYYGTENALEKLLKASSFIKTNDLSSSIGIKLLPPVISRNKIKSIVLNLSNSLALSNLDILSLLKFFLNSKQFKWNENFFIKNTDNYLIDFLLVNRINVLDFTVKSRLTDGIIRCLYNLILVI